MNARTSGIFALTLLATAALCSVSLAQEHHEEGRGGGQRGYESRGAEQHRGYVYDNRYNHGHYYPGYGTAFRGLPEGARMIHYRDGDWYFHGGAWYRPYGGSFIVVAPPIGIGIGVLPPYYSTVWIGGVPYYYADGTYYLWQPERQEYVVTDAPSSDAQVATAAPEDSALYAYPKNGQSDAQQATDRYECHSWAVRQTGFDPTAPLGGVPPEQTASKRSDYMRAQRTCLEGRGYSVN